MRTNRANAKRRKPVRPRIGAFEPLGTRIALSAGGIGPMVVEMDLAPGLLGAPVEHSRMLSVGGEFSSLEQNVWHRSDGAAISSAVMPNIATFHGDGLPKNDGPGWRQQAAFVSIDDFSRPAMLTAGPADHRLTEVRVAPASVQVSGTNLVLPGLLVSRGDAMTLVIHSPIFGQSVGLQSYFQVEGRGPLAGERSWTPKASLDLAAQQASRVTDDNNHGDPATATTGANQAGPNGTFTTPPRASDVPFMFSAIEPKATDARMVGGWTASVRREPDVDMEVSPSQAAPTIGQWAISKTQLDDGFIELESPLSLKRKARKLTDEASDEGEHQQDNWSHLQDFAQRVFSAWNEAWRDFGGDAKRTESIAEAAPRERFDSDVMDGLVELVVEGTAPMGAQPRHDHEHVAEGNAPVRIDAGIAIYQQFEVATAAEATPPATARNAERKPDEETRAEAEKPAEGQPVSAAAVGAGMIIGLPLSFRRRLLEDEQQLPRLRR